MRTRILTKMTAVGVFVAACSSQNSLPSSTSGAPVSYAPTGVVGSAAGLTRNAPLNIAPMQGGAGDFATWKSNFRARALSSGISPATFAAAEPYLVYKSQVVASDRNQSEFVKPIWEYVDSAVNSRRGQAQSKAAQYGQTLAAIEGRYGVDKDVLMGIWGMETNFGGFMGNTNVFSSMASLAYEGRRRDFAEIQLINALNMVQTGERSASALVGSWGGGMGQTQFIPSSFTTYAVDYNGDGRRNIWETGDALASTANYLRNEGWTPGQPWGVEVRLPSGFNYAEADTGNFRPSSYWSSKGVTSLSPRGLPGIETAIYLPAGMNGPAFAITRNFHVIKRYNPSDSYALAVGLLGDVAFGLPYVQSSWPRHEQPLRRSEVAQVQTRLMAMGYDTGGADGVAGRNTRASVRSYQASIGMTPDGFLNRTLFNRIMN